MLDRLAFLSRWIHDRIFDGPSQSLCARAWDKRHTRAGAAWVFIFGRNHCEAAFRHWRGR